MDRLEEIKEALPWVLVVLTNIVTFYKDTIRAKFTRGNSKLEQDATREDVESKQLDNVEREISIYRDIVTDLKTEVLELRRFVKEQKAFIKKQARSLEYYEKKYGTDKQ